LGRRRRSLCYLQTFLSRIVNHRDLSFHLVFMCHYWSWDTTLPNGVAWLALLVSQ
jgi:hypothetical protein